MKIHNIFLSMLIISSTALQSEASTMLPPHIPQELPSPITVKTKKPYDWNYWAVGIELGVNKQFNFERARRQRGPHAVYQPRTPAFGVDYRLSIEKSWKIAERWTFALDMAVFTPAFAFGYLLSPRMRVHFGFHVPIIMLSNNHTFRNFSLPAPRVGFDYFIASRTLLRVSASLDCTTSGKFWWPQIMIGIKQLF